MPREEVIMVYIDHPFRLLNNSSCSQHITMTESRWPIWHFRLRLECRSHHQLIIYIITAAGIPMRHLKLRLECRSHHQIDHLHNYGTPAFPKWLETKNPRKIKNIFWGLTKNFRGNKKKSGLPKFFWGAVKCLWGQQYKFPHNNINFRATI